MAFGLRSLEVATVLYSSIGKSYTVISNRLLRLTFSKIFQYFC